MLQNNDIKEILEYKDFDERALNYIVNAIEEFESLFGQYISKENKKSFLSHINRAS